MKLFDGQSVKKNPSFNLLTLDFLIRCSVAQGDRVSLPLQINLKNYSLSFSAYVVKIIDLHNAKGRNIYL